MENKRLKRLPIGIQTFSDIREGGFLYVDKTREMYNLANGISKYVFLSRPRRFGKSLLTSTLRSYFEGRKELFEDLAICELEKEWIKYPVLHFDMSFGKHMGKEQLEEYLGFQLAKYEPLYGITDPLKGANNRLTVLIQKAYEQTGQKVVVLIDEYDAPLLDVVHEDENLPILRNVMRNFYSPLKGSDPYLRFVFLTGITKFSQLSIFSELNNITNVSMLPQFASICGFTKEELNDVMHDYVDEMAKALDYTHDKMMEELTNRYDGYHFTLPSPDIFNPYSLLNALGQQRLDSYWFGSGTPTYLIEMMRKFNVAPTQIGPRKVGVESFDAPAERLESIIPLLYQSGYLTIKDGNPRAGIYTLDIPNNEIRTGLNGSLLPNYVRSEVGELRPVLFDMSEALQCGDIDTALQLLKDYLLTLPFCIDSAYEVHYQQLLYIIFSLMGYYVDVEVRTSAGRVDMVMRTAYALYLIELQLNKSAEIAKNQINLKNYAARFTQLALPIVKVGMNFSTEEHTITEWVIDDPMKK